MTIQAVYGITARCNLCLNDGPLVRYNGNQYNIVGYEDYTQGIKNKALTLALDEGFITIPRVLPNPNAPGGVIHNDQHICPACQAEFKHVSKKKSKRKARRCNKKIW